MIPIVYKTGDCIQATERASGTRVIAHCVNDIGVWGAGFVLAISRRWRAPEQVYLNASEADRILGRVEYVGVEMEIFVANIYGQHGVGFSAKGQPPIRYPALKEGFRDIRHFLNSLPEPSVHMPRIGCGLAGGVWDRVEPLIIEELSNFGISVVIYDLPKNGK